MNLYDHFKVLCEFIDIIKDVVYEWIEKDSLLQL